MDTWVCPACGFEGSDPECPEQCPRCDCQAEKYECPECGYFGYFFSHRPEFCPSCGQELVVLDANEDLENFDEELDAPEEPTESVEDEKLAEIIDEAIDDEVSEEATGEELNFDKGENLNEDFTDADDSGDEETSIL